MGTHYQGTEAERLALDAFIKLKRASESITSQLAHDFSDWNITESQFGILEALHHLGPMCQKVLGDKILKSTGNITLVVDNLEKRDFVTRVRDTEDRRFITIHLTTEGRNFIQHIFPDHVKRIFELFSVLSDEEQVSLGKICKKLGKKETL